MASVGMNYVQLRADLAVCSIRWSAFVMHREFVFDMPSSFLGIKFLCAVNKKVNVSIKQNYTKQTDLKYLLSSLVSCGVSRILHCFQHKE